MQINHFRAPEATPQPGTHFHGRAELIVETAGRSKHA